MTAAAKAKPQVSRLGSIECRVLSEPLRMLFYGTPGTGKSTLASNSPAPIFFDCENGTRQLEVARYPFSDEPSAPSAHVPRSLNDIYAAIGDLETAEHGFKTLIIDTADALESLIWAHVCTVQSGTKSAVNKSGKRLESIEDLGYGRGYVVAVDEWRRLCHALDRLRVTRNMAVVILGHATIRTWKNPLGDDHDRIVLRVHDKAAGFLKEWSDVVGYCAFDEGAAKLDPDDHKAKGWNTGRRLIHLERGPAFDAKTRIPLPPRVEMQLDDPWGPFAKALEEGCNTDPADLLQRIEVELKRIGDEDLAAKVRTEAEKRADDAATLSRYLNSLKERQPKAA